MVIGHGQLGIVHLGICRAYMYGTCCNNVLEGTSPWEKQIPKATFIGSPNYRDKNKTRQKGVVYIHKKFMENTAETFKVISVENFSKKSTNFSTLGGFLQLL